MADDPAVRVDLAYELVIARNTVQALSDELSAERRRLDASVQAFGRAGPLRGSGTMGPVIRALALLVGGMVAFAILSLGLQTLAPRWVWERVSRSNIPGKSWDVKVFRIGRDPGTGFRLFCDGGVSILFYGVVV